MPQLKFSIHTVTHCWKKVTDFCGIGTAATVQESNLTLAVEVVCNQNPFCGNIENEELVTIGRRIISPQSEVRRL